MTTAAAQDAGAGTAWSLVQYTLEDRGPSAGRPLLGIGLDGVVHAPPRELAHLSVMEVLDAWAEHEALLRGLREDDVRAGERITDAVLLAPLTYPRKVLCAGANYYDHAAEMGTARPDPTAEPFFFLKTPTTTVVGPGAVVPMPGRATTELDWEAELGVVVSRRCKNVTAAEAGDHVAGYVVADDLSDRGSFPRENAVFPRSPSTGWRTRVPTARAPSAPAWCRRGWSRTRRPSPSA